MNKLSFLKVWLKGNLNYMLSNRKFRSQKFSKTTFVHPKVKINAALNIGENCSIMAGNEFRGGSINIGNRVIVGPNCLMMTDNHDFGRKSMGYSPYGINVKTKEVVINSDVWIGSNVIITPGTRIGNNCVVAAGSVLFGAYPDNSIIRGNPAQVVDELVVSDKRMPITEVRTLKLNIVHLFTNLKLYAKMEVYDLDYTESWRKKYIFWAKKIVNGD